MCQGDISLIITSFKGIELSGKASSPPVPGQSVMKKSIEAFPFVSSWFFQPRQDGVSNDVLQYGSYLCADVNVGSDEVQIKKKKASG